ncbi:MAG: tetratricopeptide repeat protein, partial [Verrucomicrobiota bacterium]|nr:tetratricopeptide repeat protein [Verrucomicrobiota bacterium]
MDLLAEGRQKDAEELVDEASATFQADQQLLFLRGVLERSRFRKSDAFKTFSATYALGTDTVQGQAALASATMDFKMGVDAGFVSLRNLIKIHPDEILLRWLFAIQCRTHRKYPEEAEEQYRIILDEWKPGPVMVCHTYANILTESLGRPEEALAYRERALLLAERGWTYQGYANTLRKLGRYEEASAAFEKAVGIVPMNVDYWRQWGKCLMDSGHVEKAYEVFRKAYEMGLRDSGILKGLGRANELGRGTTQNDIQALAWYKLAAAEGSGWAMYRIGRMREDGRGDSKDHVAAAGWYQKSVEAGYGKPVGDLTRLYVEGGYGLDRDLRKAEEWFGRSFSFSASTSDRSKEMQFSGLAFTVKNTSGSQSGVLDYNRTCKTLRHKVSQGDEGAKDLLAWLYAANANPDLKRKGAAVNLAEELCRTDETNPQWKNTLAMAYAQEGRFDEAVKQQQKAIRLLSPDRQANKEGRAYAARLKLYESGKPYVAYCGDIREESASGAAAPGRYPGRLFEKGWGLEHGKGVEKNYAAAMECYRKSAERRGDSPAWMRMGMIHLKGGFGIDRNIGKAVGYFSNSEASRNLSEKSRRMEVGNLIMQRADLSGADGFSVDYAVTIAKNKNLADYGNDESAELLAWIYATCEVPRYRNGGDAVRLA